MTITQLKYIIAVDQLKSFNKAAEHCSVTQSTLSMQIKKLEESLDVTIFDRTKRPLQATLIGEQIINQAQIGISEIDRINNIVKMGQHDLSDKITIGIIPTISPYLLPLFLIPFHKRHPNIKINIEELVTEDILYKLLNNQIDVGILVTPLENSNVQVRPLFYESFLGYISEKHSLSKNNFLQAEDLTAENLWLLENGHCFRNQVLNICKGRKANPRSEAIHFESGNLETLRKMVECQHGFTLLPELATLDFNKQQKSQIKRFEDPVPLREVSLVSHKNFYKKSMMEQLAEVIKEGVPAHMLDKKEMANVVALTS